MPIKSPLLFTKAPPEFPWFTAASVCMNDCIPFSDKFLALADTIPAVTVDVKLYGFPTAKTQSPTFIASESAKVAKGSFSFVSIFSKAISILESVPISLALNVRLSFNRSEEHTSELQSRENLVCRLLLEKKTCLQIILSRICRGASKEREEYLHKAVYYRIDFGNTKG